MRHAVWVGDGRRGHPAHLRRGLDPPGTTAYQLERRAEAFRLVRRARRAAPICSQAVAQRDPRRIPVHYRREGAAPNKHGNASRRDPNQLSIRCNAKGSAELELDTETECWDGFYSL